MLGRSAACCIVCLALSFKGVVCERGDAKAHGDALAELERLHGSAGVPRRLSALRVFIANRFYTAPLCEGAGRLTFQNGGFRPGQSTRRRA
jgi:hypothetical protein